MPRIEKIAVRKPSGAVKTAPIGKSHDDIGERGKRGFVVDGKFTGREESAKVAQNSGQVSRQGIKHLHSHQVKKGARAK